MAVAVSVFEWESNALKDALARQEKLGFAMRGRDERLERPQGRAVATPPLPGRSTGNKPGHRPAAGRAARGLVLDLTRVVSGPVATGTIAAGGAHVLRQTRQPQAAREPSPGRLTCSPASAARS